MRLRLMVLVPLASVVLMSSATFATNAQNTKMKTCNEQANEKSLKGDARKTFMDTCLSTGTHQGNAQQAKMKTCNHEASGKGLKGAERQTFMKGCLSAN